MRRCSGRPAALELLAKELPQRLSTPEGFARLPALFAEAGVDLVYVEAFPGAKIDGCSFMLDHTPVIAISGRGKRLDKVLWTLLHEIAHVVLSHVSTEVLVESLDDSDHTNDVETNADEQAGKWLLPPPCRACPQELGQVGSTRSRPTGASQQ